MKSWVRRIQSNDDEPGQSPQTAIARTYYPALDSLRFFAFVMVFGFHQGFGNAGLLIADCFAMTIDLPLLLLFGTGFGVSVGGWVEHALSANGWIGVNLFFCLSGFIITHLLLREENQFGSIDWLAFWMRRILRIWPLYFLIWLIGFGGLPWPNQLEIGAQGFDSPHALPFALFLGNWSMIWQGPVGSDILSVLWSVCVEEQFYLVIPIALSLLCSRSRKLFCVLGILGALFRRWQLVGLDVPQYQMTYDSLAQMDSILAGVLLALVLKSPRATAILAVFTRKYLAWLIFPLTLFLLSRSHLGHDVPIRRVFDPLAIAFCSTAWLLLAIFATNRWARFLSWSGWVRMGQVSYGLYMWHEVVLTSNGSGFFSFLLTCLIAMASYHFFERPILRFKKRWTKTASRSI
ncbi:MAG: acyltransferase family protein [bacterium]